jgi:hypothetical protein
MKWLEWLTHTYGGNMKAHRILTEILNGRDHLKNLIGDMRIILQ